MMGEPVTLYSADGETVTVYTRSQAETRLASGLWFATAAEAEASKADPEAVAPPEPKAAKVVKRPAKGKAL